MNICLSLGVQDTLKSVSASLLQSLHFTHVALFACIFSWEITLGAHD